MNPSHDRPTMVHEQGTSVSIDFLFDTAIVRVVGELEITTSYRLGRAIRDVRDRGKRIIIVDFTRCGYIDASVLSMVRTSNVWPGSIRVVVPDDTMIRRLLRSRSLRPFCGLAARSTPAFST